MGLLETIGGLLDADFNFDWAEFIGVIFVLIGFMVGLFSSSEKSMVAVVCLFGLMFGRAWFAWKKRGKVPIFLIMMGFVLGTLVWFFFVDPRVLIVVFCIGAWIGHLVFKKKLLRSVR